MLTTHFINNGALQTAFNETGSGVPFVLVHGFTGSKLDFQNQLGWFGHTHRVVAYDQRGHGETSNFGPYRLYDLVADLIGLLDALDIPQCHILGHSLGGMVVMRALLAHPERFNSAILMDTAPYPPKLFSKKILQQLNAIVSENGCEALFDGMHGQQQSTPIKRGIEYLGEAEHWRRIRIKLAQMDPQAFVQLGAVMADHPSVLSSLRVVTVPTTIIVGAEDTPFIEASGEMAEILPNAHLVVIDEAGHSPQYENAELWRETITDHLLLNTDC